MAHAYRFGVEEAFFLADARSRGTPRARLKAFHAAVEARMEDGEREQPQIQVEIASPPTADLEQARAHLAGLRLSLSEIGAERGIPAFASGTHPAARWRDQGETDKPPRPGDGERPRGMREVPRPSAPGRRRSSLTRSRAPAWR